MKKTNRIINIRFWPPVYQPLIHSTIEREENKYNDLIQEVALNSVFLYFEKYFDNNDILIQKSASCLEHLFYVYETEDKYKL